MQTKTRPLLALVVVSAGLALNGFILGPMWLLTQTAAFSETAALPTFALSQRISWALLSLLIALIPALLETGPQSSGRAWLTGLLQVALAAQSATLFVMGFVAPWLADVAPSTLDIPGGTFQVAMTSVWVAFIVATVVAAVVMWRRGHSRVGCALMMLGALAIPVAGPVGSGLLAAGLALGALSRLRSTQADPLVHSRAGA